MATATPHHTEREVTVTETVKNGVTLELNDEESQFVADILCRIGGDSHLSRRKHADSIRKALENAGYDWGHDPFSEKDYEGDIFFNDEA